MRKVEKLIKNHELAKRLMSQSLRKSFTKSDKLTKSASESKL